MRQPCWGDCWRCIFNSGLPSYWAWQQAWKDQPITQPALFIGGTRDPATTLFGAVTDPVAAMRPHVPNVVGHLLEGCGHWTQQERPAEVNALLVDWLAKLPRA